MAGKPVVSSATRYILVFIAGGALGAVAGAYYGPRLEQQAPQEIKPRTPVRAAPAPQTPPPAPDTGASAPTGPVGAEPTAPTGTPK